MNIKALIRKNFAKKIITKQKLCVEQTTSGYSILVKVEHFRLKLKRFDLNTINTSKIN